MGLGKLPVPGHPTIWISEGQELTARAVGAVRGCLDICTLIYLIALSLSLGDGPIETKDKFKQSTSCIGPSRRERENKNNRREKKCPNNPLLNTLQAQHVRITRPTLLHTLVSE